MFDDDAEDTRGRAERGKKNEQFRELFMSVKAEIANDADVGSVETNYKISTSDVEFVEPLIERLENEGRTVTYDEDTRKIHIDSSEVNED
jgi:hypothetical protein